MSKSLKKEKSLKRAASRERKLALAAEAESRSFAALSGELERARLERGQRDLERALLSGAELRLLPPAEPGFPQAGEPEAARLPCELAGLSPAELELERAGLGLSPAEEAALAAPGWEPSLEELAAELGERAAFAERARLRGGLELASR